MSSGASGEGEAGASWKQSRERWSSDFAELQQICEEWLRSLFFQAAVAWTPDVDENV